MEIIYLYGPGETPEDVFHSVHHPGGHSHEWETCWHDGVEAEGSHLSCGKISIFKGWEHQVCFICGCERYTDKWGEIFWKEMKRRAEAIGALEKLLSGNAVIFPTRMADELRGNLS